MKTGSFFTYTGDGRISVARYAPRGIAKEIERFPKLAPGSWFNKVTPAVYKELYHEQLHGLCVEEVWDDLCNLVAPHDPVLLCWEHSKADCHRRYIAQWFKDRLGRDVDEVSRSLPSGFVRPRKKTRVFRKRNEPNQIMLW